MTRTARPSAATDRLAVPGADQAPLTEEITRLADLDLAQLRVQFRNHTGRIAPARLSRALLLRVLAYRLQADHYGDLRPDTRRLLQRIAAVGTAGADQEASRRPAPVPNVPRPGTVLVREWQGRLERVNVSVGSFEWNGTVYTSLSAVAFAITGTKWNGRRFFGLDQKAGVRSSSRSDRVRPAASRNEASP